MPIKLIDGLAFPSFSCVADLGVITDGISELRSVFGEIKKLQLEERMGLTQRKTCELRLKSRVPLDQCTTFIHVTTPEDQLVNTASPFPTCFRCCRHSCRRQPQQHGTKLRDGDRGTLTRRNGSNHVRPANVFGQGDNSEAMDMIVQGYYLVDQREQNQ